MSSYGSVMQCVGTILILILLLGFSGHRLGILETPLHKEELYTQTSVVLPVQKIENSCVTVSVQV